MKTDLIPDGVFHDSLDTLVEAGIDIDELPTQGLTIGDVVRLAEEVKKPL